MTWSCWALNLALRFAVELASLAALAYWGWHDSETTAVKLLLAIGAPVVWAVLWGTFASCGRRSSSIPAPGSRSRWPRSARR